MQTEFSLQSLYLKRFTEDMRIGFIAWLCQIKSRETSFVSLLALTVETLHTCLRIFWYGLYRHKKHHFFFILPLSLCYKTAPFCSRLTCLTVVIIKKMVQCTPDTWFIVKLRHGVTMIHQTASVRAEGETQRNGEPRVSAHPSLLLFFFGLYITLYVPNLFLLFTHKHIHRAKFLCKSSLMWSEFN